MQTINKIVYDLLEIIRAGSISKSETISIRQIEEWINEYRALLIKQSVDKGYDIVQGIIQSINCIDLEQIDKSECCGITTCTVLRTKVKLPKFIRTNDLSELLMFVGTVDGKPFQILTEQKAYWYQFRKWISGDTFAFVKNNYLYIVNNPNLEKVTIRGVFENPLELMNYINGCTGQACYDIHSDYPIPSDILPILKGMILKQELGIEATKPSDKSNDGNNIQTPNVENK